MIGNLEMYIFIDNWFIDSWYIDSWYIDWWFIDSLFIDSWYIDNWFTNKSYIDSWYININILIDDLLIILVINSFSFLFTIASPCGMVVGVLIANNIEWPELVILSGLYKHMFSTTQCMITIAIVCNVNWNVLAYFDEESNFTNTS